MHHVAMTHHHHNSHLTPVGASPQYSVPPQQPPHTPSTPVSRRTSVDSNPGKGKKRKSGPHAGYDHNGMLSEVSQKIWDFFSHCFLHYSRHATTCIYYFFACPNVIGFK